MPFDTSRWFFVDENGKNRKSWDELFQNQQEEDRKKANQPRSQKFAAIEHKQLGDNAFADLIKKHPQIAKALEGGYTVESINGFPFYKFSLSDSLQLTPGDITALAGDFYGISNKPISAGINPKDEPTVRFENCYKRLAEISTVAALEEVKSILKIIAEEELVKTAANRLKYRPSLALLATDNTMNTQYMYVTRYLAFLPALFNNRYQYLALNNVDHFGKEAHIAYEAGHTVALNTAKEARKQNNFNLLTHAFAQEFFAAHFLTDSFAAGHIRTPRSELMQYSSNKYIAGYLAKAMHDEDGYSGLNVKRDIDGKSWRAYGDHCLTDEFCDNELINEERRHDLETTRKYCIDAMIVGLEEIYHVYLAPQMILTANNYKYKKYLPKLLPENKLPLFEAVNNTINVREDYAQAAQVGTLALCWQLYMNQDKEKLDKDKEAELKQELEALHKERDIDDNSIDVTQSICRFM